MANIGKRNTLTVLRDSPSGMYLDGGEHGEILLPNRYVTRGLAVGNRLEVFVYRDSEDRLVASTEIPRAAVGEVATLKVVSVNRQIGAFLDWGLAKDQTSLKEPFWFGNSRRFNSSEMGAFQPHGR